MRADASGAAPEQRASTDRDLWRWRVVAACLALAAVCFHQVPGRIVPDTKLDLTANPAGLLRRAIAGWDDDAMGQLQNQAYGYLFPVGPFHWLLQGIGVPSWVAQRLWWSLILGVAFVGFWRLAGALRIGSASARFCAAILFALSPKFLGEVAITSVEVWPMAIAPWVLVPLVDPQPRSSRSRVIRSASAVAFVGGVNAVATGAVLILPTLWFLTRSPVRCALRQWTAWLAACVAACLWWLLPLLLLGRYSPAFLDWIEDARATTAFSSPMAAVQGTTAWLNYLTEPGGPSWPAGWLAVSVPGIVFATALVGLLGVVGLSLSGVRERAWLWLSVTVGLVLLTAGYLGTGASWVAASEIALLDGPLAAARNTHKFDLVVRIPLLLGVALLLSVPMSSRVRARSGVLRLAVGLVVIAVAAPALGQKLPRASSYSAIPAHWHDASAWLDSRAEQGAVLVLPASSFADFAWGSTRDEPFQALLRRPFVVRDAVPLGSAGATRVLDEIMRRLADGDGGPEVKQAIAGLGVRYVAVRNDLRLDVAGTDTVAVHEALLRSGLDRVAAFGPTIHRTLESDTRTVDERTVLPYPSVEIFDAGQAEVAARLVPLGSVLAVDGGPEDIVDLSGASPAGGAFTALVGSDAEGMPLNARTVVLTDGNRRQEVEFGRVTDNRSAPLAPDESGRRGRVSLDYEWDAAAPQVTSTWSGVETVTVSSSADDADSTILAGGSSAADAALDGDLSTRWLSGTYGGAVGEWFEVSFERKVDVSGAMVAFSSRSPVSAKADAVVVQTDTGTSTIHARVDGAPQPLGARVGPTSRLRLTLASVHGGTASAFSIAELSVPGVIARRGLALPRPAKAPSTIVLRSQGIGSLGCHDAGGRPVCAAKFLRQPDEPAGLWRQVDLPVGASYSFQGDVVARAPGAERLLRQQGEPVVTASSTLVPSAAARAAAALDGRTDTGWIAGSDDATPSLTIELPRQRSIRGLKFLRDPYLAASKPRTVEITFDGGTPLRGVVDRSGWFRASTVSARRIHIRFVDREPLVSIESRSSFAVVQPVGTSEIVIDGAEDDKVSDDPARRTGAPCGFGPSVRVGDTDLPTRVEGTVGDVLAGRRLRWVSCRGAEAVVPAGRSTIDARATAEFTPVRLQLGSSDAVQRQFAERVTRTGLTSQLPVRFERSVLTVPHNFNEGWTAVTEDGTFLEPIRVNGWQQGYLVNAGAPVSVTEEFVPNQWHRASLLLGLTALLCLALAALRRGRGPSVLPLAPASGLALRWSSPGLLVLACGWVGVGALIVVGALLAVVRRRGWPSWTVPPFVSVAATLCAVLATPHRAPSAAASVAQVMVVVSLALGSLLTAMGRDS